NGASRTLAGIDLTYRYSPLSQASYRGLVWGTELLYNQEDRPVGGFPSSSAEAAATSLAHGLGVPTLAAETRGSPFALADPPATPRWRRPHRRSRWSPPSPIWPTWPDTSAATWSTSRASPPGSRTSTPCR